MWNQNYGMPYGSMDYPYQGQPQYQGMPQSVPQQQFVGEEPLDWNLIKNLDPIMLKRNGNIAELQPFISDFIVADFEKCNSRLINHPLLLRLCLILQYSLLYMSDVQKQMQKKIETQKKEMKNQSEKLKKVFQAYKKLEEQSKKKPSDFERCPICRKKYKNIGYLDKHFHKDHQLYENAWRQIRNLAPQPVQQPQIAPQSPELIQLLQLYKELKDQLENERQLRANEKDIESKSRVEKLEEKLNHTQSLINEAENQMVTRNLRDISIINTPEPKQDTNSKYENFESQQNLNFSIASDDYPPQNNEDNLNKTIHEEISQSLSMAVDELGQSWGNWEKTYGSSKSIKNPPNRPIVPIKVTLQQEFESEQDEDRPTAMWATQSSFIEEVPQRSELSLLDDRKEFRSSKKPDLQQMFLSNNSPKKDEAVINRAKELISKHKKSNEITEDQISNISSFISDQVRSTIESLGVQKNPELIKIIDKDINAAEYDAVRQQLKEELDHEIPLPNQSASIISDSPYDIHEINKKPAHSQSLLDTLNENSQSHIEGSLIMKDDLSDDDEEEGFVIDKTIRQPETLPQIESTVCEFDESDHFQPPKPSKQYENKEQPKAETSEFEEEEEIDEFEEEEDYYYYSEDEPTNQRKLSISKQEEVKDPEPVNKIQSMFKHSSNSSFQSTSSRRQSSQPVKKEPAKSEISKSEKSPESVKSEKSITKEEQSPVKSMFSIHPSEQNQENSESSKVIHHPQQNENAINPFQPKTYEDFRRPPPRVPEEVNVFLAPAEEEEFEEEEEQLGKTMKKKLMLEEFKVKQELKSNIPNFDEDSEDMEPGELRFEDPPLMMKEHHSSDFFSVDDWN